MKKFSKKNKIYPFNFHVIIVDGTDKDDKKVNRFLKKEYGYTWSGKWSDAAGFTFDAGNGELGIVINMDANKNPIDLIVTINHECNHVLQFLLNYIHEQDISTVDRESHNYIRDNLVRQTISFLSDNNILAVKNKWNHDNRRKNKKV